MSIELKPGERITIGSKLSDAEKADIYESSLQNDIKRLHQQNAQLTRRLRDLEEDNAHLRELLTRAMAELKDCQRRVNELLAEGRE